MFCEKCGSPMNDTDAFCMNCGHPAAPAQGGDSGEAPEAQTQQDAVSQGEQTQADAVSQETLTPAGTVSQEETQMEAAPQEQQTQAEAAVQGVQAQTTYTSPVYDGGASVYSTPAAGNTEPPKKKSKLPIILGIVAAVVILAAGVCALNAKAMNNFIHKTFNSPEEYYQWVEMQAAKDIVLSAGQIYNDAVLEMTNLYDKSVSGEIGIELGEEGIDLLSLAGLAGLDLSWLESGAVSFEISNKTGYVSADAAASLNQSQLASASLIVDVEDQMFYVQVPELSKTWLAFGEDITEFGQDEADEYFDAMEELEKNAKAFPTQKEIENLVDKYVNLAIGCIDNVDMDSTTIEAEGISQKCTALKVTLNQKTLEKLAKTLSKSVEKDKDIEKLFEKVAPLIDEDADADELYEDFVEKFMDVMEELPDSIDEDSKIVMTVYVDGKGRICGREVKMKDYWGDEIKTSTIMPQKGSKFGYEFNYEYDTKVKVTGSGTRSRDKLSGDFVLKYNGTKLVNVTISDFDTESVKKGYVNGKFSLTPDKTLVKTFGYSDSTAMSWLQDLQINVTVEMAQGSTKMQIGADLDGEKLGVFSVSAVQGKGKKPSVPSENVMDIEDESDLMDYVTSIDWDAFLKKLEKSNMPSEIIDSIEEKVDMLEYYY